MAQLRRAGRTTDMTKKAYIIDSVRTPRGRGKAGAGALSGIHPQELLAQTLNALADRTGIDKANVDDVVVGCVTQAGEQGACIARFAALQAGFLAFQGADIHADGDQPVR